MNFILDVHCHTVNSGHAYSTVSENVAHAAKVGIQCIGISDHAPSMGGASHIYNFRNQWILPKIINGVRVYKGVECNILDENGLLDMPDDLLDEMEFVIASFHRGTFVPVDMAMHTCAAIAAMENKNMHIWGHPADANFPVDIPAVVAAAAQTSTIIEINNQTLNPDSYRCNGNKDQLELLKYCKELKVPILASSDAHFHEHVGELSRARELILQSGIPEEQVLNTSAERFVAAIKKKRGLYK
ncbi:MAG: PHP domain-containing protein [Defluviitaleaceae bacterium]|nr:PHP domain-containing protein [Defluviitaleaceae bacterium]